MKKGTRKISAGISIGLALLLILSLKYADMEPRSSLGYWKFRTAYQLSFSKSTYLQSLHTKLIKYEGGSCPPNIANFLVSRLNKEIPQTELDAICDLSLALGNSRRSPNFSVGAAIPKTKVMARLIERLPTIPDTELGPTINWIEELRRNKQFHKGALSYSDWTSAIEIYQNWWNRGIPWSEKMMIYPLENTSAVIHWGP